MSELVIEAIGVKHGKPEEGMECACCMDDMDDTNYVEYRSDEEKEWLPSLFCETCVETLLKRQWTMYEESLGKATCKAQQKRMLGEGPPTHIYDKKALPCPEGESVHSLWYMRDKEVHSALLDGAPQGDARQIWWNEKLAFQFEEDEDEQAKESGTSTKSTIPSAQSTQSPTAATTAPSTSSTTRSKESDIFTTAADSASTPAVDSVVREKNDAMEIEEASVDTRNDVAGNLEKQIAATSPYVGNADTVTTSENTGTNGDASLAVDGTSKQVESMDDAATSVSSSSGSSTAGSADVP